MGVAVPVGVCVAVAVGVRVAVAVGVCVAVGVRDAVAVGENVNVGVGVGLSFFSEQLGQGSHPASAAITIDAMNTRAASAIRRVTITMPPPKIAKSDLNSRLHRL